MRFDLAAVVAGAIPGCARNQPHDVAAGVEFELALGGTARLAGGDLRVAFSEVVEDSRCPIDAICVPAGRATVRLAVDRTGSSRALPHPAHSCHVTLQIDSK